MSQPTPQQMPHPTPQQVPHPGPQPAAQPHRQEMMGSTETLGQPSEAAPTAAPHAANTLRSSSPKPDASELFLKSKALLDSKRKCETGISCSWPLLCFLFESPLSAAPNTKDLDVYIKRNQESGFGFRVLGGEGPDQPVGNSCGDMSAVERWMDRTIFFRFCRCTSAPSCHSVQLRRTGACGPGTS